MKNSTYIITFGALAACGSPSDASLGETQSGLTAPTLALLQQESTTGPMVSANRVRAVVTGRAQCAGSTTWGITVRIDSSYARVRNLVAQITSLPVGVTPVASKNESYPGLSNSKGLWVYENGAGSSQTWCMNTGGARGFTYKVSIYGDVVKANSTYAEMGSFDLQTLESTGEAELDPISGDVYLTGTDPVSGPVLLKWNRKTAEMLQVATLDMEGPVAFDRVRDKVYVAQGSTVLRFDPATFAMTHLASVGGTISSAAVATMTAAGGAQLFLGTQGGAIYRVDPSTGASFTFAQLSCRVSDMVAAGTRLFATAQGVYELSSAGHATKHLDLGNPRSMLYDELFRRLVVADATTQHLWFVNISDLSTDEIFTDYAIPAEGPMFMFVDARATMVIGSGAEATVTPTQNEGIE